MITTLLHPSILIFIFTILLFLFKNNVKIFAFLAILCPIVTAMIIIKTDIAIYKYKIYNYELQFGLNYLNRLVCLGFCIVTLAANIFNFKDSQKKVILIGHLYFGAAIACISADDWIGMFGSLEMMMISASILIFMGNNKESSIAAQKYFLTHFVSGSLILIGICYIIANTNNIELIELTSLLQQTQESNFFIYLLIFTGCLINVAAFPFSFWMTNYYPQASNNGLVYLINFTTKVSLIILIKLFRGTALLEIFGVLTIIYSTFKACKESNIRKLLCYMTLGQLGIMLIGISIGTEQVIHNLIIYIFIHILYKCLLTICSGIFSDNNIFYCEKIGKIDDFFLKTSLMIAVITMLSLPSTTIFYAKTVITNELSNNFVFYINNLPSVFIFIMLPVKEYLNSNEKNYIHLNYYTMLSLIVLNITLLIFNFLPLISKYLNISMPTIININFHVVAKQIMIISSATIIYKLCKKLPRNTILNNLYFLVAIENYLKNFLLITWQKFIKNKAIFNYKINKLSLTQFDRLNLFSTFRINVLNTSIYASFILLLALLLTLHYR